MENLQQQLDKACENYTQLFEQVRLHESEWLRNFREANSVLCPILKGYTERMAASERDMADSSREKMRAASAKVIELKLAIMTEKLKTRSHEDK